MKAPAQLLLGVALLVTMCGAGLGGHPLGLSAAPMAASTLDRLESWATAVEAHKAGTLDEPARLAAGWPRPVLDALFPYQKAFLVLVGFPTVIEIARIKSTFGDDDTARMVLIVERNSLHEQGNRFIKHAALLHTDIAMLSPSSGNAVNPRRPRGPDTAPAGGLPRRLVGTSLDGRGLGDEYTGAHWDIARAMLDAIRPGPDRDEDVRLWYRAIDAYLAGRHLFADQGAHLVRGREIFPDDPALLLATGCHFENYASARVQTVVANDSSSRASYSIGDAARNRTQALFWFERALAADPTFVEARVHFGRALGDAGRHAEAAAELRQAVDADEPLLRYFARLLLGAEFEALGELGAARESYAQASSVFPRAQSPWLALSQLAERQGARGDAEQALARLLALGPYESSRVDPWWAYYDGDGRHAATLIAQTRESLARGDHR